jgi:LysM repeat protein
MDYVIQPGDTLTAIGARFGVTVEAIVGVNPILVNPNAIYPGQIIRIPLPGQAPVPRASLYIIQPGDTMAAIARRFNIPVSALLRFNPQITNPNIIFPGQLADILSKVGLCRSLNAVGAFAKVNTIEIQLQYMIFGVVTFYLQCDDDLLDLSLNGLFRGEKRNFNQLLGDSAAALNDFTCC